MKIEVVEQCSACKGTGLYKGMAERDGYAVVCHRCDGTGKYHFVHEYEEFTGRKKLDNVSTVVQYNPGIVLGKRDDLEFGGMDYEYWLKTGVFPPKSEMRYFVCPAWWYQTADYKLKPEWDKCIGCGSFRNCKHFDQKNKCWDRWDEEHGVSI